MKTKKIEKTFWVSDSYLSMLKAEHLYRARLGTVRFSTHEDADCTQKITVSWEVPEKKVTITESEFDEFIGKFHHEQMPVYSAHDLYSKLKQKLFGERND